MSAAEKARRIRRWIRLCESRLVSRAPWLAHQNLLGAALLTLSAGGMVGLGWMYWLGWIAAPVCVLGNAFLASILHELEHDLIHGLYFKNHRFFKNAMMLVVWAFRGNVPHGWYRRTIHFHHHAVSGTTTDVEERLVGLGAPWSVRRCLISVDGFLAFVLNAKELERQVPGFRRRELALAALPFYPLFAVVLVSFAIYHVELALGVAPSAMLEAAYPAVAVLAVTWVAPNYLRQAALSIVSSNVHYYGDVESVHQETQLLHPAFLWPLQLFCFNFGATHSFHHYVVEQPFYLRQLVAPRVTPYLRKCGVRENDTGTFWRANRFRLA